MQARATRADILKRIWAFLPLGIASKTDTIELDYICGLEGEYQELAIMQAAHGHLIRLNHIVAAKVLESKIKELAKNLSAQERKQQQAQFNTPTWGIWNCVECRDTGIIKSYGPSHGRICYCSKGKAKKIQEQQEQKIIEAYKNKQLVVTPTVTIVTVPVPEIPKVPEVPRKGRRFR